ncbi:hypothetical protein BHM03_00058204 [Ensete ventricosum]|nr:hypothetical protein BHM03_00058204 [Ensete ventricosum]
MSETPRRCQRGCCCVATGNFTKISPHPKGVVPRENQEAWLEVGVCPIVYLVLVPADLVRFGSTRLNSVRFGLARLGSIRFSPIQFSSVQFESNRFGSIRLSSVWLYSVWFSLARHGSVYMGWVDLIRSGSGSTWLWLDSI